MKKKINHLNLYKLEYTMILHAPGRRKEMATARTVRPEATSPDVAIPATQPIQDHQPDCTMKEQ
jgi:hypothetical protein